MDKTEECDFFVVESILGWILLGSLGLASTLFE